SFSVLWPPPRPRRFPYTTLFRSDVGLLFVDGISLHIDAPVINQRHMPVLLLVGAHDVRKIKIHLEARAVLHERDAIAILDLAAQDRKSTRLNSSHVKISYAVFCS